VSIFEAPLYEKNAKNKVIEMINEPVKMPFPVPKFIAKTEEIDPIPESIKEFMRQARISHLKEQHNDLINKLL
jgi:hypothetical protein